MKRTGILVALLILLCGCGNAQPAPTQPTQAPAPLRRAAVTGSLADPSDGVGVIPLEDILWDGIYPTEQGLILVGQAQEQLVLTGMTGDSFFQTFCRVLPKGTDFSNIQLQVWQYRLSYYDAADRAVVVLDMEGEEIARLDVPEDAVSPPLLSQDQQFLYYCTESAIRVLELETGLSRVLKQTDAPGKALAGLYLEDRVLACTYQDDYWGQRQLFLCTRTGRLFRETSASVQLSSWEHRFYAVFPNGSAPSAVFGSGSTLSQLLPQELRSDCRFLPRIHGAVAIRDTDTGISLEYYDLETGVLADTLPLSTTEYPRHIAAGTDGRLYFILYDPQLGQNTLLCWSPDSGSGGESHVVPYSSAEEPDAQALAQCREYALRLEEKHGIRIRFWTEATATQPAGYVLTAEHQPHLILESLGKLDQQLSRFPDGFFRQFLRCCGDFTICLVRNISPEDGNPSQKGLFFWDENRAFIALTIGSDTGQTLCHELCHMMEIVIFTFSNALDSWDTLNPKDFSYDYDYETNRTRQDHQFLQSHSRSFVDMYSMSFPKEDRARIFEYAMMEGNRELFQAPQLQKKLQALCLGIRDAFGLKKYPQALPWEQYLQSPLYP